MKRGDRVICANAGAVKLKFGDHEIVSDVDMSKGTIRIESTGLWYPAWMFELDPSERVPPQPPKFNASGSKYLRNIKTTPDGKIDVYAVLIAFNVISPARQHAIKKLLCAGIRGKNNELNDIEEARDAIDRDIELMKNN